MDTVETGRINNTLVYLMEMVDGLLCLQASQHVSSHHQFWLDWD